MLVSLGLTVAPGWFGTYARLMSTKYAKLGDAHIAYTVGGEGPPDILLLLGEYLPVDSMDEPRLARSLRRLSSMGRCVTFNRRGVGLSDPPEGRFTIEQFVDDMLAVLDACEIDSAFVLASNTSGPTAIRFAAEHPSRTSGLILVNTYARLAEDESYPGMATDFMRSTMEQTTDTAGEFNALELFAPSVANDERFRTWWEAAGHRGASPSRSRDLWRQLMESDERRTLERITSPTLCIHRAGIGLAGVSRYLAEHIADAKAITLPGEDLLWWVGDSDAILDEVESFISGASVASRPRRRLATVLFVDLVGSTERAAAIGDRRWRDVLGTYQELAEREIARAGGDRVGSAGDGVVATFDMPADAVRAARRISDEVGALEVEVRAGVHTGEIEVLADDVAGIGVHIAARVMSLAQPGEVWVSRTVVDLVTGSGLKFEDRGAHDLKGVPGRWELAALAT